MLASFKNATMRKIQKSIYKKHSIFFIKVVLERIIIPRQKLSE